MKRPTVIALILLVACAGGTALTAQAPASTASRRAGQLKSRLRNLVVAQEQFWAGHGTYTTDVSALGIFNSPKAGEQRDSIWVQVIQAGGRSWWGRSSHLGDRGKSCVIYVGFLSDFPSPPVTDDRKLQARSEGEPLCDDL
jgi:hypothetical protein